MINQQGETMTKKAKKKDAKALKFALPGGRFPIHDIAHATHSLGKLKVLDLTPEDRKAGIAAILKKYPEMKIWDQY